MTDYNETPVSRPAHPNNRPGRKRQGGRPLGYVDHHIVGSLPGCTAHFQNPETGYATNYGIGSGDGRGGGGWWIHEYVPADQVAWGNGNTFLNEYGVSVEHENNLAVAINGKPRMEVHELSARFLAYLAKKWDWRINGKVQLVVRDFPNHDYYGESIPGFGTEFNVITHRSVALKDCPGQFDIHWQVARANELLAGDAGKTDESEEDDMKPFLIWKRNPNGTRQWAHISGDLARMVPIWKLATANALGTVFGPAIPVDQTEWDGYVAASEIEVKLIDATEPDEN
ncbi:peptidoglycan recognition protein family protein [Agromyces lapidis]|uniref:N-acetylmuramoyl-L-alanine amidase n=1 Tax=Agromyces lapidis TaxID=279574 RepID=A0ABV5SMY6_9MICO|nr:N-acetylmuramoyl-L-alanine amidase [Agromyces lapidis]